MTSCMAVAHGAKLLWCELHREILFAAVWSSSVSNSLSGVTHLNTGHVVACPARPDTVTGRRSAGAPFPHLPALAGAVLEAVQNEGNLAEQPAKMKELNCHFTVYDKCKHIRLSARDLVVAG